MKCPLFQNCIAQELLACLFIRQRNPDVDSNRLTCMKNILWCVWVKSLTRHLFLILFASSPCLGEKITARPLWNLEDVSDSQSRICVSYFSSWQERCNPWLQRVAEPCTPWRCEYALHRRNIMWKLSRQIQFGDLAHGWVKISDSVARVRNDAWNSLDGNGGSHNILIHEKSWRILFDMIWMWHEIYDTEIWIWKYDDKRVWNLKLLQNICLNARCSFHNRFRRLKRQWQAAQVQRLGFALDFIWKSWVCSKGHEDVRFVESHL